MATKKTTVKNMAKGEIEKTLSSLREEVRMIHFKAEGARSKNVKELRGLRKKIARMLTELNAK